MESVDQIENSQPGLKKEEGGGGGGLKCLPEPGAGLGGNWMLTVACD